MLRYLDEIVRAGSIRKAGERLNVSPSAINRQVLALEIEIGGPIFERLPRKLRLTAAGELLILHVRQTLKEHEQLAERIDALKAMRSAVVTIATVGMLASGPVFTTATRLHQRHPRLRLNVRASSLGDVTAAMLNGEADLGLAYNMPFTPRLQVLAEYDKALHSVMAPDHPLAGKSQIRMTDCLAFPLAIPDTSTSIRPILERALPTMATLSPALETNATEMLREAARVSPYITFLNDLDVAADVARGTLRLVPVRELLASRQKLTLVCRRDGVLDAAAYLVANEVKDVLGGKPA
jgi:DNA-binding transcriptional LysR family regulator